MAGNRISIESITISENLLQETRAFFIERGNKGFEGLLFWIGKKSEPTKAQVTRVYIPQEQIAQRTIFGVSVELPPQGFERLVRATDRNEVILVKIHSHPKEAFLSKTDAANHMFRFEGAIQIIVPDFCKRHLSSLEHCAIFRFRDGQWGGLSHKEILNTFTIVKTLA